MTRFVPSLEVAQNKLSSGDQQTEYQELASEAARAVQVVPFGLVMTRFVPVVEAAQNKLSSGDQQTESH